MLGRSTGPSHREDEEDAPLQYGGFMVSAALSISKYLMLTDLMYSFCLMTISEWPYAHPRHM